MCTAELVERVPTPGRPLVWPRAALFEDGLSGIRAAGFAGAVILPAIAIDLTLAGAPGVERVIRKGVVSLLLGLGAWWLRGRIQSRTVVDPEERAIHDAVKIGAGTYIQSSVPFSDVVAIRLAMREPRVAQGDEKPMLEARIELVCRGARRVPVTDWVGDDGQGADWRRLEDRVATLCALLDAPLDESEGAGSAGFDRARFLTWAAALVATGGVLVALG